MKKKLLFYLLFLILVISGALLALSTTKGFFKVKLPNLGYVDNFSFVDQNNDTISQKNINNKVYVAEYFFTTCTGICPKMNANMALVYNQFKTNPNFAIISHTSMPETDSVAVLKKYEEKMIGSHPDYPAKWYFVTGPKDSLYKMARQSYKIDDQTNSIGHSDDDFIHTQFFALVDQQQRVRGIYDGLKKDEIKQLEKDISKLLSDSDN